MSIFDGDSSFKVTVESGTDEISGWESVSITRSLEQCSGTFTLEMYDQAPEFIPNVDEEIKIFIGNELIITGYVDSRDISISENSYTYSISGRDKTADLIDCMKENPPYNFSNQTLGSVAKKICSDFDITVNNKTDTDVYRSLTVEQGQSIYSFLDEYAQKKGFLINSNPEGELIIYKPTSAVTIGDISEGYGTTKLSIKENFSQLYSKYVVKGKSNYTNSKSVSVDNNIKRYRPLVIVPDKPLNGQFAQDRAKWEQSIRIARSYNIDVDLDNWYIDGELILPGYLVNFNSDTLRLDDEYLISTVTFNLSNSEYSSSLKLVDPNTYSKDDNKNSFSVKKKKNVIKKRV